MKLAKTVWLGLAAGVLALGLLTSCGGMEYPASSPGGTSSGSSGSSDTSGGGTTGKPDTSSGASTAPSSSAESTQPEKDPNENLEAYRKEVLRLVNEARAEQGLAPLAMDNVGLTEIAQDRAESMPSSYYYCSEISWRRYETPEQLVNAMRWHFQPGGTEPANMYREDITQIGIGFYYNKDWKTNSKDEYYWDVIVGDEYFPINTEEQRESYRQEVLDELNKIRKEKKLPLLRLDASLNETAQKVSSREIQSPDNVIGAGFYSTLSISPENLAQDVASSRKNYIENADYNIIGVGITTSTQDAFPSRAYFIIGKGSSSENNGGTTTPGTSDGKDDENSASMDKVSEKTEAYRQEILRLINVERTKNDLEPLNMDNPNLTRAAQRRANELAVKYDSGHLRPDGRQWYTVLPEYKVNFQKAAENIAQGQVSPAEVVDDWMHSPGHRKNILDPDFHRIGIGVYCEGGRYCWVQDFTD